MSMAEPRRRRKWSLNPRGTHWANDDNKFGQKLMEKMGWSKGSGLGREEQGIKEHLTVRFKDDNKGIGFKGSDDEWIKHYEGFESVLASLNSQENVTVNTHGDGLPHHTTVTKTSLESSSKASKARVHYHKFTRGKDLSQCSEDDLGCILGSKRAKQLAEVHKTTEEEITDPDDAVGTIEHSMGVTTIKGCSMQEYFAKKMEALKNGAKSRPQPQEVVSMETVWRPGFGASCDGWEDNFMSLTTGEEIGEKKKKKKKQHIEIKEILVAECQEKSDNCIEEETGNVPKKKKKKRGDINLNAVKGNVYGNNTVNSPEKHLPDNTVKNFLCQPIGSEIPEKKKKKRKKKQQTEEAADAIEENSLNYAPIKENIKIKKKKHLNISEENCSSSSKVQEHHEKKKKKKKKNNAA